MLSATFGSSFSMDSRMILALHRIQAVQQVGDSLKAGVGTAVLLAQRLQALVQGKRNLLRDLRRKLPQLRHALDRLRPQRLGQAHQQFRSLFGLEVGQNQGNGLRMFFLQKLGQLLGVGFLQRIQFSCAHLR